MLRYMDVKSSNRNELIDITRDIEKQLGNAGAKDGVCYVYVPHTTAAVTINEGADPSVKTDILDSLSRLVPRDMHYRHAEGNADAHVKSTIAGASQFIPVKGGKLALGTWQSVYFCEFDGPRNRRVAIQFIPGD
ncbi:MAG: secondary thiamine-phosphate synthase enzyme YjbQ [Nitrospirota bacterium]|jgi:secondary thiamine-phosphate synthase enzyme